MSLFATKPISKIIAEAAETGEHTLKKTLTGLDLTMLGVGAIIGTGIFVLTGQAAGKHAGPAVIISMILAGIVSAFAALCYSEFAACVPISGSAYAYGYGTLGEFVAWIIGWDLILEYAFRRGDGRGRMVRLCREFVPRYDRDQFSAIFEQGPVRDRSRCRTERPFTASLTCPDCS